MTNPTERDQKDAKRYRWLLENVEMIGLASGDREPDSWISTKNLSKRIDEAMEHD